MQNHKNAHFHGLLVNKFEVESVVLNLIKNVKNYIRKNGICLLFDFDNRFIDIKLKKNTLNEKRFCFFISGIYFKA